MEKEKGLYDGFIFNGVVYFLAMFVASFAPLVMRTIASFFIKTESAWDLKSDLTPLFNTVYPIVGFLTIAGFLVAGYFCSFFVAQKISYKTQKKVDPFKVKMQFILPSVLIYIINLYFGFIDAFATALGIQFWYPAAVFSRWFGIFNPKDAINVLADTDFVLNNFVLRGLAYEFNALTVLFSLIISVGFVFACYFGRKKGEEYGIKQKENYLKMIHGEKN